MGLSMKPSFKTTKANGTGTHTKYSGKYRFRPAGGAIAPEVNVPGCLSDAAQPETGVASTHYKNGDKETQQQRMIYVFSYLLL